MIARRTIFAVLLLAAFALAGPLSQDLSMSSTEDADVMDATPMSTDVEEEFAPETETEEVEEPETEMEEEVEDEAEEAEPETESEVEEAESAFEEAEPETESEVEDADEGRMLTCRSTGDPHYTSFYNRRFDVKAKSTKNRWYTMYRRGGVYVNTKLGFGAWSRYTANVAVTVRAGGVMHRFTKGSQPGAKNIRIPGGNVLVRKHGRGPRSYMNVYVNVRPGFQGNNGTLCTRGKRGKRGHTAAQQRYWHGRYSALYNHGNKRYRSLYRRRAAACRRVVNQYLSRTKTPRSHYWYRMYDCVVDGRLGRVHLRHITLRRGGNKRQRALAALRRANSNASRTLQNRRRSYAAQYHRRRANCARRYRGRHNNARRNNCYRSASHWYSHVRAYAVQLYHRQRAYAHCLYAYRLNNNRGVYNRCRRNANARFNLNWTRHHIARSHSATHAAIRAWYYRMRNNCARRFRGHRNNGRRNACYRNASVAYRRRAQQQNLRYHYQHRVNNCRYSYRNNAGRRNACVRSAYTWYRRALATLSGMKCASTGDPHYTAFNGKRFDLKNRATNGKWYYMYRRGSVYVRTKLGFQPWRNATANKYVIVKVGRRVYHFNRNTRRGRTVVSIPGGAVDIRKGGSGARTYFNVYINVKRGYQGNAGTLCNGNKAKRGHTAAQQRYWHRRYSALVNHGNKAYRSLYRRRAGACRRVVNQYLSRTRSPRSHYWYRMFDCVVDGRLGRVHLRHITLRRRLSAHQRAMRHYAVLYRRARANCARRYRRNRNRRNRCYRYAVALYHYRRALRSAHTTLMNRRRSYAAQYRRRRVNCARRFRRNRNRRNRCYRGASAWYRRAHANANRAYHRQRANAHCLYVYRRNRNRGAYNRCRRNVNRRYRGRGRRGRRGRKNCTCTCKCNGRKVRTRTIRRR